MKYKPQISKTAAKVLLLFGISKFADKLPTKCAYFSVFVTLTLARTRAYSTQIYTSAHIHRKSLGGHISICITR